MSTPDRSDCGCTWERRRIVIGSTTISGDVIVVQCLKHAAEGRTPRARAAVKAADAYVAHLRREGRVR